VSAKSEMLAGRFEAAREQTETDLCALVFDVCQQWDLKLCKGALGQNEDLMNVIETPRRQVDT
jgi:hypothetical protein